MATERTVVSLSKEARAAVAKRMASRGETASTYFSGGPGGRFVDQDVVDSVGRMTPEQRADAFQQSVMAPQAPSPSDEFGPPDNLVQAYRRAQALTGLRQGQQDVEVTMGLFMSPAEQRATRARVAQMNVEAGTNMFEDARSLAMEDRMASTQARIAEGNTALDFGKLARRGVTPTEAPLSSSERGFERAYLLSLSHRRKRSS